jgi:hypothetical protein
LEGQILGWVYSNSIGNGNKDGIWIDRSWTTFENADEYFNKGVFIGIGIIQHPKGKMECFATWNGQLLGKIIKFKNVYIIILISIKKVN